MPVPLLAPLTAFDVYAFANVASLRFASANVKLLIVQFALYDLLPVEPFAIVTVVCAVVPFEPVQPANV